MSKHTISCNSQQYHAKKTQQNTIMSKDTISFHNTLYHTKHSCQKNSAKHALSCQNTIYKRTAFLASEFSVRQYKWTVNSKLVSDIRQTQISV